ncbi:hypothetical protein JCM10207_000872 [Rhodosporidiobolus poonsookiae]
MAARPPLPFGLGRDPACASHRCNAPGTPLPGPGNPLYDQVAQSLSQLFQTFFCTSLRYLGVSEVLDWVESSGTIDAWILTGLEQGRLPEDISNPKNLDFGREAIKSVIQSALDAEDEAWATSLRETGFSSSVSMVYEGIVAQLKPTSPPSTTNEPVPCLHTLLTPTGLALLKSAPLKSAFPSCPVRPPPSCAPLLASIRTLVASGALSGPAWKSAPTWRAGIRKAFAAYHTLLRELAEEIVTSRDFALEYRIFLESISPPLALFQLVADDFEAEFGSGATRGLLGVGDAGGDNLISIMDFCAARKPSELLARVKQRVAEKQAREKRQKEVEALRGRLKALDARIRVLLLEYRTKGGGSGGAGGGEGAEDSPAGRAIADAAAARLQKELELALDERDAVKAEVEELQRREEEDEGIRKRERAEKEKALAAVGVKVEGGKIKSTTPVPAAAAPVEETKPEVKEEEELGCVVGSSREMMSSLRPADPFATNAPRSVSPAAAPGSSKGKGKALDPPSGKSRTAGRYAPPPPSHRYNRLRDFSPAPASSRSATPSSSRAASPAPSSSPTRPRKRSSRKRAPPSTTSTSTSTVQPPRAKTPKRGSRLRPCADAQQEEQEEEDYCRECCPACAAELRRAEEMVVRTQKKREERKDELRGALRLGVSQAQGAGGAGAASNEALDEANLAAAGMPSLEQLRRTFPNLKEISFGDAAAPTTVTLRSEPKERGARRMSESSLPELEEVYTAPTPAPVAEETATGRERRMSASSCASMPPLEELRAQRAAGEDEEGEADDPPEIMLEPVDGVDATQPLGESTNLQSGTAAAPSKKPKKKKKKKAGAKSASAATEHDAALPTSLPPALPTVADTLHAAPAASVAPGSTPLSRYPPPKCCPPHICTNVGPNYAVWAEMDTLLFETCLAGFKYELIGALPHALALVRDTMAKNYLLAGGRMTTDQGEPKEMDSFLAQAEQRGLWHSVNYPEVQAWGLRVLAISLQKLVDVLRATLGEVCVCKMSQHLEILREARHRLDACEQLDRQIPIDLPEMDHQQMMKWAHVQLREHKLSGPEWEGLSRQYVVGDFLLAFSDAFDAAMDRLVLRDPLLLAEDVATLLEWQGGVRTFETALRLASRDKDGIVLEFGTGVEILEGRDTAPVEKRPLQAWARLLELSAEARTNGTPFSRDLAEEEKQRGNDYFAAGEYEKAIVSFTTSSIIFPLEPTFSSNAAAARMKLGTQSQYAEAICDCTIALFHDHRNIKALYRRGMALALIGQWKAAFADLKYLDRIAPDCQPAKEALAWANERYNALVKSGKAPAK